MKYWLDEEFIEDGKTIDLVSVGLVAEDGRKYYAQSSEFDAAKANEWVQHNVLTQLRRCFGPPHIRTLDSDATIDQQLAIHSQGKCGAPDCPWRTRWQLKEDVLVFVNADANKPQFWGYYADYDWVALCQLFGTMMDLPEGWPMYCRDLKQWCDMLGNPKLPPQEVGEHNALADALWNREAWAFLRDYEIRILGGAIER